MLDIAGHVYSLISDIATTLVSVDSVEGTLLYIATADF